MASKSRAESEELFPGAGPSTLRAPVRMDGVTAVMHEIELVVGYDHEHGAMMLEDLEPGTRRLWDERGNAWDDNLVLN